MANKKRFDVMYGEKYGDPNEPKTAWKRAGTLFQDEDTGRMSIKLDMIPVGRYFDGWLSVFEPRDKDAPNTTPPAGDSSDPVPPAENDEKPIDLSEIPF